MASFTVTSCNDRASVRTEISGCRRAIAWPSCDVRGEGTCRKHQGAVALARTVSLINLVCYEITWNLLGGMAPVVVAFAESSNRRRIASILRRSSASPFVGFLLTRSCFFCSRV
jgi:hypothetical protein